MKPGLFITFEGLDGTGKTTQLRRAVQYIRKCGHRVLVTREPGGTRTGERVRDILLASKTRKLAPLAELALMYAARAQLLEQVVRPALARGEVVVSDRYNTASFAYQGYGRELGNRARFRPGHLRHHTARPDHYPRPRSRTRTGTRPRRYAANAT
jgi:dTMP kinase